MKEIELYKPTGPYARCGKREMKIRMPQLNLLKKISLDNEKHHRLSSGGKGGYSSAKRPCLMLLDPR